MRGASPGAADRPVDSMCADAGSSVGSPPMSTTHRNALIIIGIACLVGTAFGVSFTLALDRPKPHEVPAGIVVTPSTRQAAADLEAHTQGGLAFRPYPTTAAVEQALDQQLIYAGLVPSGAGAQLLVASAAGSSVAEVFERAAGTQIVVVDVRPLPDGDSSGLLPFYLTLAATVTGFVTMFQLRTHASRLSLRAWLLCVLSVAAITGGMLAILTGTVTGSQHGPLPVVWAALTAMIVVAALWASTMQVLAGPWTFIPTFVFLMVVGIPSSGGAVATSLLPAFYRFLARFVPSGAAVETIRDALYFRDTQDAEPIAVLAAWIVCLIAALLLAARLRGRTPGGQPYHPGRCTPPADPPRSCASRPSPHRGCPSPSVMPRSTSPTKERSSAWPGRSCRRRS